MRAKENIILGNPLMIYSIAMAFGVLTGMEMVNEYIQAALYTGIACVCFFFILRNDMNRFFAWLPFLAFNEILIRNTALFVPYLFISYFYIASFGYLLIRTGGILKVHSRAFIFLLFFVLIEYLNTFRSNDLEYARFLLINSAALVVIVLWASSYIMKPKEINTLFSSIKIAGIYLCGIIMAAHIRGNIQYGLESSHAASNGLAPVQISGYMGLTSIIFFLSIVSGDKRQNTLLNIILFMVNSTIMLLSFSRGGLYFVAAVAALYFLFNLRKIATYGALLLLVPVVMLIYNYVSTETGGIIQQRYEEQSTSGRIDLAKAAFTLFSEEPLAGIGTANFVTEIEKQGLFRSQSGAHNEFTRVAAEHGILGIITYWGFYIFLFAEIVRRKKIQRDFAIYFFVLFCLIIVHNGLKISIQPLILMLVVATPSYRVIQKSTNRHTSKRLAGYAG